MPDLAPLALEPKDVKALLRLSSVEKARGLWSDPNFPGFEDEGRLLVDADDLRTWWKRRKELKLQERSLAARNDNDDRNHAQEEGEAERGPEEAARVQGGDPPARRFDYSKVVLFADLQRGG